MAQRNISTLPELSECTIITNFGPKVTIVFEDVCILQDCKLTINFAIKFHKCLEKKILLIFYEKMPLKKIPLSAILTRNISSSFFQLSSCQYVSTIHEKTACYRPFGNGHFVRVCREKMMDHQYRENGERNVYSNYSRIRAYVECSPDQSKYLYLIDLPSSNRRSFKEADK